LLKVHSGASSRLTGLGANAEGGNHASPSHRDKAWQQVQAKVALGVRGGQPRLPSSLKKMPGQKKFECVNQKPFAGVAAAAIGVFGDLWHLLPGLAAFVHTVDRGCRVGYPQHYEVLHGHDCGHGGGKRHGYGYGYHSGFGRWVRPADLRVEEGVEAH